MAHEAFSSVIPLLNKSRGRILSSALFSSLSLHALASQRSAHAFPARIRGERKACNACQHKVRQEIFTSCIALVSKSKFWSRCWGIFIEPHIPSSSSLFSNWIAESTKLHWYLTSIGLWLVTFTTWVTSVSFNIQPKSTYEVNQFQQFPLPQYIWWVVEEVRTDLEHKCHPKITKCLCHQKKVS